MKSNQKNKGGKESHLVNVIYLLLAVIIGTLFLQIKDLEYHLFPIVMYITTWFIVVYDITAYIHLIDTCPYSGRYGRFAIDISIFVILFVITISQSNLTLYLLFLTLFFSFIWGWHHVGLMQYKDNEELREGKNNALIYIFLFTILTIVYGILSLTKYSWILSNCYINYIFIILIWLLVINRFLKIIGGRKKAKSEANMQ